MKYLKLFEVFDIDWGVDLFKKNIPKSNFAGFEEDWEDEETVTEGGPFDDILIFKASYTDQYNKFHQKDRVFCIDNISNIRCRNKIGTIVNKGMDYLVCFDENITNSNIIYGKDYNVPPGHGLWVPENKLRKI